MESFGSDTPSIFFHSSSCVAIAKFVEKMQVTVFGVGKQMALLLHLTV
jgi:hypothetical protein